MQLCCLTRAKGNITKDFANCMRFSCETKESNFRSSHFTIKSNVTWGKLYQGFLHLQITFIREIKAIARRFIDVFPIVLQIDLKRCHSLPSSNESLSGKAILRCYNDG